MRQLTNSETSLTCGGSLDDGYTLSFAVSNTVLGACLGYMTGGNYKTSLYGAAVFGTYALARIAAGELDLYLFKNHSNNNFFYTVE